MGGVQKSNVFIVDDHQLVIEGIKSLLDNNDCYRVVGHSIRANEAIDVFHDMDVDILLTDISMPVMTGVEFTRNIKKQYPLVKVLALSMYCEQQIIKEMIDAGASGYILKNTNKSELLNALDKVVMGQTHFSEDVTLALMRAVNKNDDRAHLTNREVEIISLIEKELSNKQIAGRLFISERTVETHRKNIFRKTNTQSIVGLLKYAYEHKII